MSDDDLVALTVALGRDLRELADCLGLERYTMVQVLGMIAVHLMCTDDGPPPVDAWQRFAAGVTDALTHPEGGRPC